MLLAPDHPSTDDARRSAARNALDMRTEPVHRELLRTEDASRPRARPCLTLYYLSPSSL